MRRYFANTIEELVKGAEEMGFLSEQDAKRILRIVKRMRRGA